MFHVVHLGSTLDQILDILDRTFDGSGDLVHILRLHDSLQVVFEHLGKVVYAWLESTFVHHKKKA